MPHELAEPGEVKSEWQPGDYILAPFGGKKPPIQRWIKETLAQQPARSSFDFEGVSIELLTWGEVGKPGLLFMHGAGAQADWWDVIAPFFAKDYRIAALSWSGMGRSGWREDYKFALWASEALKAIEVAELDKAGPPVGIAHSLGGSALMTIGAFHADKLSAGIMVDSFIPRLRPGQRPPSSNPLPRYKSVEQALARYRFVPDQGTDLPEIVDYIARHGLRQAEADGDGPEGWTWRFDPRVINSLDISGIEGITDKVGIPIGFILGERSNLSKTYTLQEIREKIPAIELAFTIPEAKHHVMMDQPLALVSALRATIQALTARD